MSKTLVIFNPIIITTHNIMNEWINITYDFRGLEFTGLKFRKDNSSYPWKNSNEADKFFDSLVEDGSEYSKIKYKNLIKDQINQNIHIVLSYSLIARFFSLLFLVVATILGIKIMIIPTFIVLGIGFVFQILSGFFEKRANEFYHGKEISNELVEVIFNDE